jgi:hypothetical protein
MLTEITYRRSQSSERYFDTVTHRMVAVGRHASRLVMVPYEQEHDTVTPITIHATARQQIPVRLRIGKFTMNEPKMFYFAQEDVLHLVIAEAPLSHQS